METAASMETPSERLSSDQLRKLVIRLLKISSTATTSTTVTTTTTYTETSNSQPTIIVVASPPHHDANTSSVFQNGLKRKGSIKRVTGVKDIVDCEMKLRSGKKKINKK